VSLSFHGASVGLVGALGGLARRQVAREVARRGGRFHRNVTRTTTIVVFGRSLLARERGGAILDRIAAAATPSRRLLSENGFLRHLAGVAPTDPGLLGRTAIIAQSGLGAAEFDALALFDGFSRDAEPFAFRDLVLARKYAGLIASGAGWAAIVRSVHRVGPATSLTAAALRVDEGVVYAEHAGRLAELDGQLLLGLDAPADSMAEDDDARFDEAEAEEAAGNHAGAAALYGRVLAADPTDAVAAFNRANCLTRLGRTADAEHDYARALNLDPGFVEAWFNLASLARDRGRTDAARAHLTRALAIDPDYADAVYNLAALEFDAGDLAAAAVMGQRYLTLDAGSEWARAAERGLAYVAIATAHGSTG
jgi:tetratricopeptide (TPR) repeat protein